MSTRAAPMTVRKTISVSCSVDHAFTTFTEAIATWWPLGTHRGWERLGNRAAEAYESYDSGWGVVLAAYAGKASEA